jgi:CopG family nickel-responsive transcriptional regulator
MTDPLVRFGVAMEPGLLTLLDSLVRDRGGTRSEVLRDLVRGEVSRVRARDHVPAVAALTLVYDHHVRDLSERLTDIQHDLGERVRSTLHVHLDHHNCLEVIVLTGMSDELHAITDRLVATKGVKFGALSAFAPTDAKALARHPPPSATKGRPRRPPPSATKGRPRRPATPKRPSR